uniref:Nonstructural protein n=1 Tax=Emberiza spodocephala parvoviridae sp. TaxID=2794481 RepID=A0A8A4XD06_9VIRU|nr:MAG: nonstructural protein [Emberiza spodocephala parvoviridae sp.]
MDMSFVDMPEPEFDPAIHYARKCSVRLLERILEHNNFDIRKVTKDMHDVLERRIPKVNTIVFKGPPGAGKSYITRPLTLLCPFYGQIAGQGNDRFMFEDAIDKRWMYIEEPLWSQDVIEQMKLVMEGAPMRLPTKFTDKTIMARTPVVITTNNDLWLLSQAAAPALMARCRHYELHAYPALKQLKKQLNALVWVDMFNKYL